jgi:hypothetical protein
MRANRVARSIAALRRKLRGLGAVADDAGATGPERANASALKERLEHRLRAVEAPAGDWTDHAFQLGRWAKGIRKSGPPKSAEEGWTDHAHRLGKAVRRGYKKWLAE